MFTRAGRSGRLVAALLFCALLGAFHSHTFGDCSTFCTKLQFFNAPAQGGPGGGTDHYAYQFKRADNYQTTGGLINNTPWMMGANQYTTTTTDPGAVCTYAFVGRPPTLSYGEDSAWTPVGPWTPQQTNKQCEAPPPSLPLPSMLPPPPKQ